MRKAATIILLNESRGRVLMLKRGPTASFMPNSMVFPGGILEPAADGGFDEQKTNFGLVRHQGKLSEALLKEELAYRVCALRELFEEAGLLLTYRDDKSELVTAREDPGLAEWRTKVRADASVFGQLFSARVRADVNWLIPWSRWVTPTVYKKRFDTMFFLVPLKSFRSTVDYCTQEMAGSTWISPADAIRRNSVDREFSLPPPQFAELERLRRLPRLDALAQQPNPPPRVSPQIVQASDDPTLRCGILPADFAFDHADPFDAPLRFMTSREILHAQGQPQLRLVFRNEQLPYVANHLIDTVSCRAED